MPSLTDNALTRYVRESKEELKKVAWPSRQTVIRHTLIVIGVAVALGAFFAALDYGLTEGVRVLVNIKK